MQQRGTYAGQRGRLATRRAFTQSLLAALPAFALGARRAMAADSVVSTYAAMDLSFLQKDLVLLRRAEWTEVLPKPWMLRIADEYNRITVHHAGVTTNFHTSTDQIVRDLDGVFTSHIDRRYGDIGYHFVLDYAGRVWEGRSLVYEGAHVVCQNERNIGIMLLGNFEAQSPSPAQRESVKRLIALLRERYKIKPHRVFGHCDLGHSVCPGRHLYAFVRGIRDQAQA